MTAWGEGLLRGRPSWLGPPDLPGPPDRLGPQQPLAPGRHAAYPSYGVRHALGVAENQVEGQGRYERNREKTHGYILTLKIFFIVCR